MHNLIQRKGMLLRSFGPTFMKPVLCTVLQQAIVEIPHRDLFWDRTKCVLT